MLTNLQDLLLVLLAVGSALLLTMVMNRFWPPQDRRVHNDVIGWQLGILGTTYAVIVGFMLYAVWTTYEAADLNADAEANALLNVYRLAEGLPDEQRYQLQSFARAYAESVLTVEWPAMAANKTTFDGNVPNKGMWQTLMSAKAASGMENAAEDHALSELSEMNHHRRIRQLQSGSRLPNVLWCVLLIGAFVTVSSSCMFGSSSIKLHAIQVSAFSLLIALILIAIGDIDRPFQGTVHVSNAAFRRAQETMASQ